MKVFFAAILCAVGICWSQDLKQGEEVFAKSCASSYCHGVRGTGAGAPRLAARGFEAAYINTTVSRGITGTSMPAFATSLAGADLTAVVAYVASLNGVAVPTVNAGRTAAPETRRPLSPAARRGRELFSDAVRGFERCSTCHEADGIGLPVAPPIAQVPASAGALRALATPNLRTATVNNQQIPALRVSDASRATIYYDLTSAPPVLHTEEPGRVSWRDGSAWRHASAIVSYSDSELADILTFLREAATP